MKYKLIYKMKKHFHLFLLILASCQIYMQSENPAYVNFELNEVEDFRDLSSIENSISSEYLIYLAGEVHQVSCNDSIKFRLLKFLHQKAGVNYFILEGDHGFAYYCNSLLSKDSLSPQEQSAFPFLTMITRSQTASTSCRI